MSLYKVTNSYRSYVDRVAQLIPTEIVAAHLTIQGLVYSHITIRDIAIEISALVFFLLLPSYLTRVVGVTAKKQIFLTMGSFVFWVLAVSLPVHQRFGINPIWGSIALIFWTVVTTVLASPNVTEPYPDAEGEAESRKSQGG